MSDLEHSRKPVAVYLEIGKKRVLAGAVEWPGWCRGGRDAGAALRALGEYAPRYRRALHDAGAISATGLPFEAPADSDTSWFAVTERLEGNSTTDFGAPDAAPSFDAAPIDDTDLRRLQKLLEACWEAFDSAVRAAQGKELRKGPRGGGRDVAGIVEHVLGAEAGYVARLGGTLPKPDPSFSTIYEAGESEWGEALAPRRQAILDALGAAARGELPAQGPRGGLRWSPRFFVRRAAWHILDHAWEIEDRMVSI